MQFRPQKWTVWLSRRGFGLASVRYLKHGIFSTFFMATHGLSLSISMVFTCVRCGALWAILCLFLAPLAHGQAPVNPYTIKVTGS